MSIGTPANQATRSASAGVDRALARGDLLDALPRRAWIDDHARCARAILDEPVPPVVMHTDVSCANILVAGAAVVAAYDTDSLAWIDELRCLGSVAVHFTYTGEPGGRWPTRDQALAFIADYEAAREIVFTARDHACIEAAMTYAIAYTARCERGTGTMSDQLASRRAHNATSAKRSATCSTMVEDAAIG